MSWWGSQEAGIIYITLITLDYIKSFFFPILLVICKAEQPRTDFSASTFNSASALHVFGVSRAVSETITWVYVTLLSQQFSPLVRYSPSFITPHAHVQRGVISRGWCPNRQYNFFFFNLLKYSLLELHSDRRKASLSNFIPSSVT